MNDQPISGSAPDEGLNRALSRWNALAIVVGAVIGTGIYIRPASIAQLVATPTGMMIVWSAAGLLSLAGALTYAELASRIPRSGGEYAYLRVTLGDLPAFLYGWMRLTVGTGTIAGLAVAVTVFLGDLTPLGPVWWQLQPRGVLHSLNFGFGPKQLIAVLSIAGLATINIFGVGRAGRFQTWVTSLKVLGLLALIVTVVSLGHASVHPSSGVSVVDPSAGGALAYGGAMLAAMAAFNGWANVAMLGGEVQEPRRNLPWALVLGISVVVALYAAANLAYLHVLPMSDIVSANSTAHPDASSVASRAAIAALGQHVGVLLPLLFLVSALGTLHSNLLAVPRVFFAMARDGLLPTVFGRVAAATRTPVVAISTLAGGSAVLAVLGSYDRLTNMAVFGNLAFFALNAFGLLRWRVRESAGEGGRSKVVLTIVALFLVGTSLLLVTLVLRGTAEISAAIVLMVIGWPVFLFMRSRPAF